MKTEPVMNAGNCPVDRQVRPLITDDIPRCYGDLADGSPCATCARRLQIERDGQGRWFPFMHAVPGRGSCVYKITAPAAA